MFDHFDIFISYRRKGGSERAEMLKLMFEKNGYSSKKIFMDTHTLRASDVKPLLQEAVEASDNFVVLITKGCFDEIKEDDLWVYEIKEAIKRHKNIIPVFFDGIESFDGLNLPIELQLLPSKNGVEYNHKYSDACFDKICAFLVHPKTRRIKFYQWSIAILTLVICSLFVYIFSHSPKYNNDKIVVDPQKQDSSWYSGPLRTNVPDSIVKRLDDPELPPERIPRNNDSIEFYSKIIRVDLAIAEECNAKKYANTLVDYEYALPCGDGRVSSSSKKILEEDKDKEFFREYKNKTLIRIKVEEMSIAETGEFKFPYKGIMYF